jgi:hypothetical protein
VLKGINKRKKEKDTSDRFGLIVCWCNVMWNVCSVNG